jgi:hypothetical protein
MDCCPPASDLSPYFPVIAAGSMTRKTGQNVNGIRMASADNPGSIG